MIGTARKNENSVATWRESPKTIPPMIVAPEREVPGMSEKHCASPTLSASFQSMSSTRVTRGAPVALVPALDREDRERAHDERDRHAHRVEEVRLDLRLEREPHDRGGQEGHDEVRREALLHRIAREARERRAKRARYSQHTARIAPSWITMSKTLPFSSFRPSRSETMIRCPVEEIGQELGEALDHSKQERVGERGQIHRGVV